MQRGSLEPPRQLGELLQLRLDGLGDAVRSVLETLAVADSLGLSALTDLARAERVEHRAQRVDRGRNRRPAATRQALASALRRVSAAPDAAEPGATSR